MGHLSAIIFWYEQEKFWYSCFFIIFKVTENNNAIYLSRTLIPVLAFSVTFSSVSKCLYIKAQLPPLILEIYWLVSLQTCELSSVKLHCNALNNRHLKMVKIGVADRDNSVCSMVICKFYRGCFLLIPTCYFFVFGFKLNWFPKCLYFSTIGETSLVGSPTHRNYFLEPVENIL